MIWTWLWRLHIPATLLLGDLFLLIVSLTPSPAWTLPGLPGSILVTSVRLLSPSPHPAAFARQPRLSWCPLWRLRRAWLGIPDSHLANIPTL